MKLKYFIPLITWLLPTIVISLIMFRTDPLSKTQNIGFIALLVSACITYATGVKLVLKEKSNFTPHYQNAKQSFFKYPARHF